MGYNRFKNTLRRIDSGKLKGTRNRAPSFLHQWSGRHQGRYWKRCLSKARRRAWKQEVFYSRPPRGLSRIEGICNWKNW